MLYSLFEGYLYVSNDVLMTIVTKYFNDYRNIANFWAKGTLSWIADISLMT